MNQKLDLGVDDITQTRVTGCRMRWDADPETTERLNGLTYEQTLPWADRHPVLVPLLLLGFIVGCMAGIAWLLT